jgi:hypothetical protein
MWQEPAGDEAEPDQPEEGQRQVENLGEPWFHPPENQEKSECGRRAKKRRGAEKPGQSALLWIVNARVQTGAFRRTPGLNRQFALQIAYSLGKTWHLGHSWAIAPRGLSEPSSFNTDAALSGHHTT